MKSFAELENGDVYVVLRNSGRREETPLEGRKRSLGNVSCLVNSG